MLTYVLVHSLVAARAELCKSRSSERLSLCPCAPAPFPHKVSSLRCGTLQGPRKQRLFRALHPNDAFQRTGAWKGRPRIPRELIRGVLELYVHLFGDGTTRRSAKRSQRAFAPALASRGASGVPAESIFGGVKMRSRKLDEKLSRHGLGARRVALLAPRATFGKCWSPLDYASAIALLAPRATFGKCWSPLDYASARLKPFSRGVFIKAQSAPL